MVETHLSSQHLLPSLCHRSLQRLDAALPSRRRHRHRNGLSLTAHGKHQTSFRRLLSWFSSAVALRTSSADPMASSAPMASSTPSTDDVSSLAVILEPVQPAGIDVLFVFMPGALTAPKEYLPLLKEIQAKCSFRLWIALFDPGSVPWVSTAIIEANFDGVLSRVKEKGFPSGKYPSQGIVIGGHSWGAWESRSFAMKRAEAFIQLGSCFHTNPDNLVQYPKPVLTLSGALDAQLTNAAIVKHSGDVFSMKDELGDFFVYGIKPVVLVDGMNHAQFSHGNPNKERGDFDAEITMEQARDVSSSLIASFITLHMGEQDEHGTSSALAVLREAVSKTYKRYHVLWEALVEPGRIARQVQLDLAAIPTLKENNIGVVQHEYKDHFIYSKPSIDVQAERIIINTYLSPVGKYNLQSNIWVKCKSREAVAAAFGSHEVGEEPVSLGSQINERTFNDALAQVPEVVRQKFEQHGKKLRFIEDMVIKSSAQEWIDSDLILKPAEDDTKFVDVQSTVLISPLKGMPARFAGMHYLKLLTTARALNWIYEDCFR